MSFQTTTLHPSSKKILDAEIVIQAFLLYFFGVPGQVKLMTDRLLSMMNTYQGQHAPKDGAPAHGLRYPEQDAEISALLRLRLCPDGRGL